MLRVALIGNPNCGKTSLFNKLTGLRQKVGNFPGVTVDKKVGFFTLENKVKVELLDLPGTYSIYPNSLDESVVLNILLNSQSDSYPDILIAVLDASNLKRSLLLFEQVKSLGLPFIVVLNQIDEAARKGIAIKEESLAEVLAAPVISINAREGTGIGQIKEAIAKNTAVKSENVTGLITDANAAIAAQLQLESGSFNAYTKLHILAQYHKLDFLSPQAISELKSTITRTGFKAKEFQTHETLGRFKVINNLLKKVERKEHQVINTSPLDNFLLHKVWGYVAFILILFLMFQAVFTLANYPMDIIDGGIASLSSFLQRTLPEGMLTNLLVDGVIAGVGGVLIFIPQIALLFGFITIMEETGYMARVIVLMDKVVRPFGMSGRSVVPLISGMACAVPAIMSARTIGGWRERIITIMVTPLMSCSARLPIYTILIALVVPQELIFGFVGLQGLALMALYFIGFLSALFAAWVMKVLIRSKQKDLFFMELPSFKAPRWSEVFYTIYEKSKTFVWEAGKVILAISMVLWVLSSYGPGDKMDRAEENIIKTQAAHLSDTDLQDKIASERLKNSYAGHFGKAIEPAIKPLGYDWKIGIALIASFAAREVFVGTISTIYSIGSKSEEEQTIKSRLRNEINPNTGEKMFDIATSYSLLVFYIFAMMCMSTLAVVYRETKGWKWPLIQTIYMTAMAYVSALIVYQVLS